MPRPKPETKTHTRHPAGKHIMTVVMSTAQWAELAALCEEEAVRCGGNPDRLRTPVIRRLIHSAYLSLDRGGQS